MSAKTVRRITMPPASRPILTTCLALLASIGLVECFSPLSQSSVGRTAYFGRLDVRAPMAFKSALEDCDTECVTEDPSRRSMLSSSAGVALSSLLLGSGSLASGPSPAFAGVPPDLGSDKRTIVLTGCNSGIGYDAASRMASRGHKLILACRTEDKARDAAARIAAEVPAADVTPAACDLASLDSVKSFVEGIKPVVADAGGIDALCLNAGLARNTAAKEVIRTREGFELTVGTNHLGHFYLCNMILPQVKKNTGRIVVTASGVHDPKSPGGAQGSLATLGDLSGITAGPIFDMVDGGSFDADKAYKDSKLCNVLFTRELQRRLDASGAGIKANCFNPGLIVGTGLFRDQNPLFTKVFDFAATDLLKVGESTHWGGGALEYMALDKTVGSKGGLYYTSPPGSSKYGDAAFGEQFGDTQVSEEAQDDAKAKKLWELSEKLVGLI